MVRACLKLMSAAVLLISFSAVAQESETRIKADEIKEKHNVTPGEDVDQVITNKLLRAESGSKSRYSFASTFVYNGGSVQKPLSEDRPNIAATTATTDKADLEGQMSAKYNLSTTNSLSAGVGMRWIAPLSKNSPRDYDGDRFDVQNPYVAYQHIYNLSGMQSVVLIQPVYYTQTNLVKQGYVSSLLLNQDSMFEVGHTGLSIGFSVWGQFGYFNKNGPLGTPADGDNYIEDLRTEQSDYLFGFAPVLEYTINDTFNLRTVTNLWNFEHLRSAAANTYRPDTVTQSFGVGISVARDIFLYPNVQFLPDQTRAANTNVGINANINVF